MKTYILMKNKNTSDMFNDIKVEDIYSIHQDKQLSFIECLKINLKIKNNKLLDKYIVKEINLDNDMIKTTYKLLNNNYIINLNNNKKYKIINDNIINKKID